MRKFISHRDLLHSKAIRDERMLIERTPIQVSNQEKLRKVMAYCKEEALFPHIVKAPPLAAASAQACWDGAWTRHCAALETHCGLPVC